MALVLLTGASSFSGLWIAEALAGAGHTVVAPLRRRLEDYGGIRLDRVRRLQAVAEVAFGHAFDTPAFLDLVSSRRWDALAHHGADIPGYREAGYDVVAGVSRNAGGAREVLSRLAAGNGQAVVIATGTTFEAGEGMSDPDDLAISPYGLSKGLTNQVWRHLARWQGLRFGKFVVAAPFGPWEEGRFAWSLFQSWLAGEPALVRTPRYVRDNLPAPLLGIAYVRLLHDLMTGEAAEIVARPSGFVGGQGDFARKLAAEARPRLGRACEVTEAAQPELREPYLRVNTDPVRDQTWDARAFWDAYVDYYVALDARGLLAASPP